MRIRDLVSFAAFGAIIFLAIFYIASLGVRVGPPANRISLSMEVADINNLVVGGNVLLRGVPVGKISAIQTTVQGAIIDFYVDDRYPIPVDSDVRLENLSALGESYIGLIPRTDNGPMLVDGQHFSAAEVTQPASISELATSVNRVLHQLDPLALQRIIDEASAALPDPAVVLPNLSRASILLRDTAESMDGRGRGLLDNFQTLLRNAGWVGSILAKLSPQIPAIGDNLGVMLRDQKMLTDRGGPDNIHAFDAFIARVQKLLDDRGADIRVIGSALQPRLNAIAGALMNFDTGQILSNMLAAVPQDGAVTLHVAVPAP